MQWKMSFVLFLFLSRCMIQFTLVYLYHYLQLDSLNVGNKSARKLLTNIINYQKHETDKSSSTGLHEDRTEYRKDNRAMPPPSFPPSLPPFLYHFPPLNQTKTYSLKGRHRATKKKDQLRMYLSHSNFQKATKVNLRHRSSLISFFLSLGGVIK